MINFLSIFFSIICLVLLIKYAKFFVVFIGSIFLFLLIIDCIKRIIIPMLF